MQIQNKKISNCNSIRKESYFCQLCMISEFDGNKRMRHAETCLHQIMTKRESIKNFIRINMKNLFLGSFAKTCFEYMYECIGKEVFLCEICCLIIGSKLDLISHSKDQFHTRFMDKIKNKKPIYTTGEKHHIILDRITLFETNLMNLIASKETPNLIESTNNNNLITSKIFIKYQKHIKPDSSSDASKNQNSILTVSDRKEYSQDLFSIFNHGDSTLLSKYDSVKINSEQYEKIFKFVFFIEQKIDNLKKFFMFSEKLYVLLKNMKPINDGDKFNNVISNVYRLEELGTGILISTDTKFRIVILIDKSIKPTEQFFEEFYERFSNIITNDVNNTYSIHHSKNKYCVLSDLESKYSIDISLASLGWNDSPIHDGLSYFTFNSLNNIRLLKSIQKYSWFMELSINRLMIARLCILIRYMAFQKNPLFHLDFWDIVIIASYTIESISSSEVGFFKIFRKLFSLLSGGILLSDSSIPNPLDASKKIEFDIPECKKNEITYYCQYALRIISIGKFSEILNMN